MQTKYFIETLTLVLIVVSFSLGYEYCRISSESKLISRYCRMINPDYQIYACQFNTNIK